jgi:hypothetical protein
MQYVLLKAQGGRPVEDSFMTDSSLKEIYKLIDCKYITPLIMAEDGWTVYIDEEGMFNHNREKPNIYFSLYPDGPVFGNVLIVKEGDKGMETFTKEELNKMIPRLTGRE